MTTTIAIVSCSKSGGSKPTLTISSINTTVEVGGTLDMIMNFKSSNLSNGTLVVIRDRLNQRPLVGGSSSPDTLTGPIPSYPNVPKGQFEYKLDWGTYLHQSDQENDTVVFKLAAIDAGGHSSDTITTPKIVVKYQ